MKAVLCFEQEPITGYSKEDEMRKVNDSIRSKLRDKVVEIPCLPTKGMFIDLSSFAKLFEFTEEELEWINDSNIYHVIRDIDITPDYIVINLE